MNYQDLISGSFLTVEAQKIMNLSQLDFTQLTLSLKGAIDGQAFPLVSAWPPSMHYIIYKETFGDLDTFKAILFLYGNGLFPHIALPFLLTKYRLRPDTISKRILQIKWIISSLKNKWYYFDVFSNTRLYLDGNLKN